MITHEDVRQHLGDFAEENVLLDREEFNDREIDIAIRLAIQDYNSTPPLTQIVNGKTPDILDAVLMLGILYQLYRGKAAQNARNQLNYSDGGITVATNDRGPFYLQLAQQYKADFDARVPQVKAYLNLNNAYGELSSDYISTPDY